ncbi:MAG: hypothetical protein H8E38_04060 [SAR324 cluster bacterium]|nr:hypothetical protein [SAR324 cluster bacterium]MBL7035292.1 hypothetical protein [SAR324 cluster bacterium]
MFCCCFFSYSAAAEELWRLRYFVPTSVNSKITFGTSKTEEKLDTSGHSGYLIFSNGIGVGYSVVRTSEHITGISYAFKNNYLDLSYTIGKKLSLSFGAGRLIYGRGDLKISGENYTTENSSGEAIFLNFGIPFIGGELLLGYRQNNNTYKNYQKQVSGETVMLADSVKLISGQINVGFGFLF